MLHFADPQLGEAVGAEQAGMGSDRMIFTWLGMTHFIEQHRRDEHRVDVMLLAEAEDHRLQVLEPAQGMVPQGLEVVDAVAEQLGQAGLGSVHAETALQFLQFLGAEGQGVGPGVFGIDHRGFADPGTGSRSTEGHQSTEGQGASHQPQQTPAALPPGGHQQPAAVGLMVLADQSASSDHCGVGAHGTRRAIEPGNARPG